MTQRTISVIPMLCDDAPKGEDGLPSFPKDPENWVMERKFDGWRFMALVHDDHVEWIGGRNGMRYESPALDNCSREIVKLPVGTVLDGEMLAISRDGKELKSPAVSTILADPSAGYLYYIVFDILSAGETDLTKMTFEQRRKLLEIIAPLKRNEEHVIVNWSGPLDWDEYQEWLDNGGEGAIVKRKDSKYFPGKRSKSWLKLKPQLTCDAVILGFEYGKGASNKGMPAAFQINLLDSGVGTTVKIPDDDTVASVAADYKSWFGRKIEIRHHGLFPNGKPRHPVMVRTREDL